MTTRATTSRATITAPGRATTACATCGAAAPPDALVTWMWEAPGLAAAPDAPRRTCGACSRALLPLIESGLSPAGWPGVEAWMPAPRTAREG